MADNSMSIEAIITLMDERDKRYYIQFVTLKEAAELNNRAVGIAMEAADKAVAKAESAVEKRFESVNEFRAQMGDMQNSFARTDLVNSRFAAMEKKLDELSAVLIDFRSGTLARSKGYSDVWGWVVGGLGVLIAVLALIFKGGP